MTTLAKPLTTPFRLPTLTWPQFDKTDRKRKQATIDLIHASPHLRRDIGFDSDYRGERGR